MKLIATTYQIESEFRKLKIDAITFDRRISPYYEGEKWAVKRSGLCLAKDGHWEFEPMPSNRDDEFYKRCRFDSLEEAQQAVIRNDQLESGAYL